MSGRRGDGDHVPCRLDADAGRVAGVERPVVVQVADVVRRVTGRGEARRGRRRGRRRPRRSRPAPARARPRAGRTRRRRGGARSPRAGRVDDVRRADLGDVHAQPGVLADERAGGAGVVEVDVREQQVADVGELEAALGERLPSAPGGRWSGRSRGARARRRSRAGSSRRRARSGGGGRSGRRGHGLIQPAGRSPGTDSTHVSPVSETGWQRTSRGGSSIGRVWQAGTPARRAGERGLEVGDQVVGRLDPDRQADEVRRRGERRVGGRGVRHRAPAARSGSRRRRGSRRASRSSCARRARPPRSALDARNETIPPKPRHLARGHARAPDASARPG